MSKSPQEYGIDSQYVDDVLFIEDNSSTEFDQSEPEQLSGWGRAKRLGKRALLSVGCIIPPVDLFGSDIADARWNRFVEESITLGNSTAERLAEIGTSWTGIAAHGLAVGVLASTLLRPVFENYDNEQEDKDNKEEIEKKSRIGRAAHRAAKIGAFIATLPMTAIEKVGKGLKRGGEWMSRRKNAPARVLGQLAMDAGMVNIIGTSGIAMQETAAGSPPDLKRNAYLSGVFATSWIGGAWALGQAYNIPGAPTILSPIGKAFDTMLSFDNPIGGSVLGAAALSLGYAGWKASGRHEQKMAALENSIDDEAASGEEADLNQAVAALNAN